MAESYPAPMIRYIPGAFALCALVGCGELESDYTLNLVPHTLQGQAPFVTGRAVELVVIEPDGLTNTVYSGGTIEGGELTIDEMPPVALGSTIGLAVENVGGTAGQVDLNLLAAWGSAVLPQALATGEQVVTVDVLVAEIGAIGDMGSLGSAKKASGAGVAMAPNGDVYIFGGAAGVTSSDPPSDRIQKMSATDSGTWRFENIQPKLPDRDGVAGRWGLAASVVDVGGSPQIFVSGGRDNQGTMPGGESELGFLFDPAEDKITWGHKDSHDTMQLGRAEHSHIVLDNGRVLIYGGYSAALGSMSVEIFNPKSKTFEALNSGLGFGEAWPAGASLGPGGALICGGGILDSLADTTTATDGCDQITVGGVITSSDPMPTPVLGHAMARLADGRILATGGITGSIGDNQRTQAMDTAWIYNGNRWNELPASMKSPRIHHEIIPMPDGNAIILGGTEEGGAIFATPTPAVVCAELFDAKSETFSELGCSGAGSGAFPKWGKVDTDGVFILAGYDAGTGSPMGDDFGFIAFPPAL